MGQKAPAVTKKRGRNAVSKYGAANAPTGSSRIKEKYQTVPVQSVKATRERLFQATAPFVTAKSHFGQVPGGNRVIAARDPRRSGPTIKAQELWNSSDPPGHSYPGNCSSTISLLQLGSSFTD